MAWDYFGVYKEGAQSPRELHILNVYQDPDFLADIDRLYPSGLSVFVGASGGVESKGNIELPNHEAFLKILKLVNSEQRQLMQRQLSAVSLEKVAETANKYAIRPTDVLFYLSGNASFERVYRVSPMPYTITTNDNFNYKVAFNLDITKEDFMQTWKLVARYKNDMYGGKIAKTKLPANDKLLYAIFKQRQKTPPTPFSKIHKMYLIDDLPGYKHEKADDDRIYDTKKFEEYYRKYKPTPIPLT